jgi:2-methylcitrate synthase/citrate synthase II
MPQEIYSPGLEGIIAGETAISTIAGGLQYRGYKIEDLAEHASFEEVAYLVLVGELPSRKELDAFRHRLSENVKTPPEILDLLGKVPPAAPMMDVLRSGTSLLAHWDEDVADNSREANLRKSERLLARLPVIMGTRHRLRQGLQPVDPDPTLSLAGNILWMTTGQRPSERSERAMDVTLVLYAEHEFNASTFTARVTCSTLSDLHSAITAAIGALKGPLHGGANEKVMDVLKEVGSPARAESWVRSALAKKTRIMGFGHRVYKTGDPRARYLKTLCAELAEETGNQAMESIADTIERVVTSEKGLPPNLDWPSARLYYYLGLPVDLYTPLFVLSRVSGWCAHVIEQLENNRLIRPRARYTGPEPRTWVPLGERR